MPPVVVSLFDVDKHYILYVILMAQMLQRGSAPAYRRRHTHMDGVIDFTAALYVNIMTELIKEVAYKYV